MDFHDKTFFGMTALFVAVGFTLIGFAAGNEIGKKEGQHDERVKCARYGFGKFVLDKATGETEFEYGNVNRMGWAIIKPDPE